MAVCLRNSNFDPLRCPDIGGKCVCMAAIIPATRTDLVPTSNVVNHSKSTILESFNILAAENMQKRRVSARMCRPSGED